MNKLTDILQIALTMPDALGYLAAVAVLLLAAQAWKSVRELTGFLIGRLIRLNRKRVVLLLLAALPLYAFRFQLSDALQHLEQTRNPLYVTSDTSLHALAVYEAELAKKVDAYELEIVKQRTRDIAAKTGSTPLAIYEVAYSECGLDPFRIRDDGIAAGWIQFTRRGLGNIATLEQVKAACRKRDTRQIMDWTEQYLLNRAAGKPLSDATAVYIAVFAPGYIGAADQQVLYQGYNNPDYYKNDIFDGYYTTGTGQIFRSRAARDGKITIQELRLHLEAKKAGLLKKRNM